MRDDYGYLPPPPPSRDQTASPPPEKLAKWRQKDDDAPVHRTEHDADIAALLSVKDMMKQWVKECVRTSRMLLCAPHVRSSSQLLSPLTA